MHIGQPAGQQQVGDLVVAAGCAREAPEEHRLLADEERAEVRALQVLPQAARAASTPAVPGSTTAGRQLGSVFIDVPPWGRSGPARCRSGGAAFAEGGHRLLYVRGLGGGHLDRRLGPQGDLQRGGVGVGLQDVLGQPQRHGAVVRDLLRGVQGGRPQVPGRAHPVRDTAPERLVGVHEPAGEQHVGGESEPGDPGQQPRRAHVAAGQAHADERGAQPGPFGEHPQVRGQGQREPRAGRHSVDRGDHRLRQVAQRRDHPRLPVQQRHQGRRLQRGDPAHLVDVVPGGEGLPLPRQDEDPGRAVLAERGAQVAEGTEDLLGQGVPAVRTVHGGLYDPGARAGHQDDGFARLVGHGTVHTPIGVPHASRRLTNSSDEGSARLTNSQSWPPSRSW